jgi:hypothetical protein
MKAVEFEAQGYRRRESTLRVEGKSLTDIRPQVGIGRWRC